jgi:hypothetical protein
VVSPTKAEMEGKSFLSENESSSNYCYSNVQSETHPEWVVKKLEEYVLLLIKHDGRTDVYSTPSLYMREWRLSGYVLMMRSAARGMWRIYQDRIH